MSNELPPRSKKLSWAPTFSNLSIDRVGTGYRLTAAAAGLTGATSNTFNITTGPAARLVFTVQPSNAVAGVNIAPAIRVGAQDAGGNPVNLTGQVTMAIGTNPPGNGALDGAVTVNASGGLATPGNRQLIGKGWDVRSRKWRAWSIGRPWAGC